MIITNLAPVAFAASIFLNPLNPLPPQVPMTPEAAEAWAAVERGWEALRAEDVDAFMRTMHPRFLGWNMSRDTPLDLDGERAGTRAFLAEYDWVSYEIDPVSIRVVDDEAIVHYRYREVVKKVADGTVHEERGRVAQVLKRLPDGWKTLTIMSGAVKP